MKKLYLVIFILIFSMFSSFSSASETPYTAPTTLGQNLKHPNEKVQARDFSYLFKSLNGFSESQLKQHYELYKGYVNKLNEINENLKTANRQKGNASHSEYRSLQIDKAYANNGVVLHELYFSNLNSKKTQPSEIFYKIINMDFGSYEKYISDLIASAKSARSGWAVTAYNSRDGKIHNYVFDSHDLHIPVKIKPILVLDTWEHAYMIDHGINKDAYINVFLKSIDWQVASQRLELSLKE